jgi:signal transduction histidine kinase
MRRLLDVLRQDEPAYAPQPQLLDIRDLVAAARETGADVELVEEGPLEDVPPGVALTAYRITQEALTNVRKHAGPVPTCVRVRAGEGTLEVEVANDPGTPSASATGSGHGLIGMSAT